MFWIVSNSIILDVTNSFSTFNWMKFNRNLLSFYFIIKSKKEKKFFCHNRSLMSTSHHDLVVVWNQPRIFGHHICWQFPNLPYISHAYVKVKLHLIVVNFGSLACVLQALRLLFFSFGSESALTDAFIFKEPKQEQWVVIHFAPEKDVHVCCKISNYTSQFDIYFHQEALTIYEFFWLLRNKFYIKVNQFYSLDMAFYLFHFFFFAWKEFSLRFLSLLLFSFAFRIGF